MDLKVLVGGLRLPVFIQPQVIQKAVPSRPTRYQMLDGDLEQVSTFSSWESAPHNTEEVYLRVISDSVLEVVYEREEQIVVETYGVTDQEVVRDTTW